MTRHKTLLVLPRIALLFVACGDEPDRITDGGGLPTFGSPEAVVQGLVRAYQRRDPELFGALLARDADRNAEYTSVLSVPTEFGETSWGWEDELRIHHRMLRPENLAPGEDPVPPELWLQAVNIDLQPLTAFQEREDLYSTEEDCLDGKCADGKLDRKLWRVVYAQYTTDVLFQNGGATDYLVTGKTSFTVVEERNQRPGIPGHFLLLVWEELCDRGGFHKDDAYRVVEPRCWSSIRSMYRPLSGPSRIDSPAAVVRALAAAYRTRDPELLQSILANDPARNAEYLFFLSEPTELGETQWGWNDEVRIHQRMFKPESPPPGDDPVAPELWLEAVDINLQRLAGFQERDDLYSPQSTDQNCPGGKCADGKLDRRIWKAVDAQYSTDVFFQLAGETDYQVDGSVARANFVVIEDLTKKVRDDGKFLLLFWEDLSVPAPFKPDTGGGSAQSSSWSGLKSLFR